jgi:hypothetical protein
MGVGARLVNDVRLVHEAEPVHETRPVPPAGPSVDDATAPRFAGMPLFVEEALSQYLAGGTVDPEALRELAAACAGPGGSARC